MGSISRTSLHSSFVDCAFLGQQPGSLTARRSALTPVRLRSSTVLPPSRRPTCRLCLAVLNFLCVPGWGHWEGLYCVSSLGRRGWILQRNKRVKTRDALGSNLAAGMKCAEVAPRQADCNEVALYTLCPVLSGDPDFFYVGHGDKERPPSISTPSLLGGLAGRALCLLLAQKATPPLPSLRPPPKSSQLSTRTPHTRMQTHTHPVGDRWYSGCWEKVLAARKDGF